MSTNAQRMRDAQQKRMYRLRKNAMLVDLKYRANSKSATKRDIVAYEKAVKDRECYLKRERERKNRSRKKLKEKASSNEESALEKLQKIKDKKHKQYMKYKMLGKCKNYDKKRRRKKVWNSIERKIKTEQKPVNEAWVK